MSGPTSGAGAGELERRIGHRFADRDLLQEALTHASALDAPHALGRNYERLEFLGDRVLGLIVAEALHGSFPDEGEDGLAPRLNALVNRRACARAAHRADLGAALIMGKSEIDQGGRSKETILADACEALIAALYLDGGFECARAFVRRFWADEFDAVAKLPRDAKTALQEWAASQKKSLAYELVDRSGPEHAPEFTIEARIEGFPSAHGIGGSKRDAERAAATAFLRQLGIDD